MQMIYATQRHNWKGGGDAVRFPYKTERSCANCDLVRVTRHEPGELPWVEWWKNGERLEVNGTPTCDGNKNATSRAA